MVSRRQPARSHGRHHCFATTEMPLLTMKRVITVALSNVTAPTYTQVPKSEYHQSAKAALVQNAAASTPKSAPQQTDSAAAKQVPRVDVGGKRIDLDVGENNNLKAGAGFWRRRRRWIGSGKERGQKRVARERSGKMERTKKERKRKEPGNKERTRKAQERVVQLPGPH